jgi:hypothetical protein
LTSQTNADCTMEPVDRQGVPNITALVFCVAGCVVGDGSGLARSVGLPGRRHAARGYPKLVATREPISRPTSGRPIGRGDEARHGDENGSGELRCRLGVQVKNVIGQNESLSSPYHHERVASLRTQTHGDMQRPTMDRYRRMLARPGR